MPMIIRCPHALWIETVRRYFFSKIFANPSRAERRRNTFSNVLYVYTRACSRIYISYFENGACQEFRDLRLPFALGCEKMREIF